MPAGEASSPGLQAVISSLAAPLSAPGRGPLRLSAVPALVLLGGLLLTAVAGEQMRRLNRARYLQIRQSLVGDVAEAITAKLQIDQAVLSSVVGLFRASESVSREEFAEFYRSVASENPSLEGITGVGFSRMLTPAELPAFEQRVRAEGSPEFRVTPPGPRQRYSAIEFLEPNSWRNRRAFGFDMYSEPVRREAMQRAAANNEPALSGAVTLLQETKKDPQPGVLLYLPIYRDRQPLQTSEERWRSLLGWAYSPIRTRDLIQAALRPLSNPELPGSRVVVLDVTDGQSPARLFDSKAGGQNAAEAALASGPSSIEREIAWGGRRWQVVLELAPHLGRASGLDASVWLTLTSGVALSSVLSLLARQFVDNLQATRRALAESEKAAEERALSSTVFEASSLAIVVTNPEGYILTANNAFTQLTGYRVNEIVGQRSNLLKSGRHEVGFYKVMWDALESRGFWEGDLWNRVRNGSLRRHHLAISSVRDAQLRTRFYVGMLQDITDRHAAEEAIRYQALHDTLTGLANRSLLMEQLEREVALGQRKGSPLALLYIDLDGFKPVNDRLGHAAGDALLLQVAERLRGCTRESDMVCRQGGDEFVILVPQAGPPPGARRPGPQAGAGTGPALCPEREHGADLRQHRHRPLPRPGTQRRCPAARGRPGHVPGQGRRGRAVQPLRAGGGGMRGGMRGRGVRLAAWLAGLQLLAGCGVGAWRLEVPVSGWPAYEYFYLAEKSGLDRPEGLAIHSVQLPDPQAVMNAFARDQFQVAQLSAAEVIDLCNRIPGRCPVVVLVLDASEGGDQLAVHNSVPSIAALKGRRVAVTFSTLGPFVLHLALERHGLRLSDVQTQHVPLERMEEALAKGRVQAAATYPPFSEAIREAGHSRMLFNSRETPGEILDLLVVDRDFLEQHPGRVSALVRVWDRAQRHARTNPQASVSLMARREGISPQAFREAERGLRYFDLNQQRELLQPGGAVERNLSRVQGALQELGVSPAGGVRPSVSAAPVLAALQQAAP